MDPHPKALSRAPAFRWPSRMAGDHVSAPDLALLDCIEALQPHRVLVLGEDTLEILCTLIRLGCEAATSVLPWERPEAASADLATAATPRLRSNLVQLIWQARRALVPQGWMVLQVHGTADGPRTQHASRLLREAGFGDVRTIAHAPTTIVVARLAPGAGSHHA